MRRVFRRFTLLQSAWTPYQSLPQTCCKPLSGAIPECCCLFRQAEGLLFQQHVELQKLFVAELLTTGRTQLLLQKCPGLV